jgi:hypothetical protein
MKILKILTIFVFFIALQPIALAAVNVCHNLEIKLPGIASSVCGPGDYLSGIYKLAVGIAVALAAIMIVYGGILWSTSGDSPSRKTEAKKHITQAIFGLVLLLASYLILNTINPDLVKLGQWQNLPSFQITPLPAIPKTPKQLECDQAWVDYVQCCKDKKCGEVGIAPAENNHRFMECQMKAGLPLKCL